MMNRFLWMCIIALVLFFTIRALLARRFIFNSNVNGVITEIKYDSKGYPTVIVSGNEYGLSFGKTEIAIGDSLVKEKESFWFEHYRNGEFINGFEW